VAFEKITAFVEMWGGCWIVLKLEDAVVLLTGVNVVFAVSWIISWWLVCAVNRFFLVFTVALPGKRGWIVESTGPGISTCGNGLASY
jgi:hypothetical protein